MPKRSYKATQKKKHAARNTIARKPIDKRTATQTIAMAVRKSIDKRRRDHATQIIAKAVRKNSMTKLYKDLSQRRNEPSIYRFRRRCELFPHPVEIFAKQGITIPMNWNPAFFWAHISNAEMFFCIMKLYTPKPRRNEHIVEDITLKKFDLHAYANNDIIIGIKAIQYKGRNINHNVFYEVRMNDGLPQATIVDANGGDYYSNMKDEEYARVFDSFFGGIPYMFAQTHRINEAESEALKPYFDHFGLAYELGPGYCGVMSYFFLLDYICTDQWKKKDIRRFVQATKEWVLASHNGYYSPSLTRLRTLLFVRYLGYKIFKLSGAKDQPGDTYGQLFCRTELSDDKTTMSMTIQVNDKSLTFTSDALEL